MEITSEFGIRNPPAGRSPRTAELGNFEQDNRGLRWAIVPNCPEFGLRRI